MLSVDTFFIRMPNSMNSNENIVIEERKVNSRVNINLDRAKMHTNMTIVTRKYVGTHLH